MSNRSPSTNMLVIQMTEMKFETTEFMARRISAIQSEMKFKTLSETIRYLVRKGIEEVNSRCPY